MNKNNIFLAVFFPVFAFVEARLMVGLRLSVGELVGFLVLLPMPFFLDFAMVGMAVVAAVVGLAVGVMDELPVGEADGIAMGEADGLAVGAAEGLDVGEADGLAVGAAVGAEVHTSAAPQVARTQPIPLPNLPHSL